MTCCIRPPRRFSSSLSRTRGEGFDLVSDGGGFLLMGLSKVDLEKLIAGELFG